MMATGGTAGQAPDLARTSLLLFLGLRLLLLVALPFEALFGYGDFQHYYQLAVWSVPGHCPASAAACWPLLDFWHEFPPVFPYLAASLARLLGGGAAPSFHTFAYALAALLLLVDLASFALLGSLARRLYPAGTAAWISLVYAVAPAPLILSWWTFDGLTTFWLLLGLWAVTARRDGLAAVAVGLGIVTKLVPLLLLPVVWRARPMRRAAAITLGAGGVVLLVVLPFGRLNPAMTLASLQAQAAKSSYATVWAIVDGNLLQADGRPMTGNFGPLSDRFDPARATVPIGQPARIPGWFTLGLAAALYGGLWLKLRRARGPWTDAHSVRLLALTWAVFLLWSKGWSPQWQQMLVPLILLASPNRQGLLFTLLLALVSFLEWPLLLSRGMAWGYLLTIPLRTALFVGWGISLARDLLPSARRQLAEAPA